MANESRIKVGYFKRRMIVILLKKLLEDLGFTDGENSYDRTHTNPYDSNMEYPWEDEEFLKNKAYNDQTYKMSKANFLSGIKETENDKPKIETGDIEDTQDKVEYCLDGDCKEKLKEPDNGKRKLTKAQRNARGTTKAANVGGWNTQGGVGGWT